MSVQPHVLYIEETRRILILSLFQNIESWQYDPITNKSVTFFRSFWSSWRSLYNITANIKIVEDGEFWLILFSTREELANNKGNTLSKTVFLEHDKT